MPLKQLQLSHYSHTVMHYLNETHHDLNPPYQRSSVWTNEQRVALIKSLFMGLPTGSVMVNHRGYSSDVIYAVVDGKQRIETIRAFSKSEFSVPANWFDAEDVLDTTMDASGIEMVTLSQLAPVVTRIFGNLSFPTSEAKVKSVAAEAKLFLLVNSAGTSQTDDDLQRAATVAKSL